jgi:hypothetical protein
MGEEGGDQDGVEGDGGLPALRIGRRDEAVHPELLLLESHPFGVDVRDPDALRRDLRHQVPGDPAVAAREVQHAAGPWASGGPPEAPGEDLALGLPDPASGVEVHRHRPLEVVPLGELEEVEHLVGGADPERDAADEDVPAERAHDEAAGEVGRVKEVGFHLCQDSSV